MRSIHKQDSAQHTNSQYQYHMFSQQVHTKITNISNELKSSKNLKQREIYIEVWQNSSYSPRHNKGNIEINKYKSNRNHTETGIELNIILRI